jgi:hypothetical protein
LKSLSLRLVVEIQPRIFLFDRHHHHRQYHCVCF